MNHADAMNEALLIYARHVVGWTPPESLIDGAITLLERRADTNELRLMAGCSRRDHPEDLRTQFRAVLESFGKSNLERLDWDCLAAREVCQLILEGKLEPWQGVKQMYELWINDDYGSRFDHWMRLDDSCDHVLSGYPPLEPFRHLTLENAEQIIREEAKRFLEQNPATACLEKES